MGYQDYSTFSFMQDEYFVSWVRNPSEESDRFWKEWLGEHPDKRVEVENARKIIQSLKFDENEFSQEEVTNLLAEILHDVSGNTILTNQNTKSHLNWDKTWIYGIAATLLILLLTTYNYLDLWSNPENIEPSNVEREYITKRNPNGIKNRIKLQDGTIVHLNSNSELTFPKVFGTEKRELYLKGEAFFEVVKDKKRPFSVKVNGIKVVALGTSFNIKTNADLETEISLLTGKVQIEHKATNKSEQLLPNERFIWKHQDSLFNKEKFESDDVIAWTKNVIVFRDADFEEIISTLTLWYGVEFEIIRKPKELTDYSGRFQDKSLDQVLEILSFSSGFDYKIVEKKVFIK